MKTLVIVESPGKIKKIGSILGDNYIVKASFGHVQDLDKKTLSVDVNDNFKPLYITSPDKQKVVIDLKKTAKICDKVILASDEDREGEAIAYSLASVLKLKEPERIVFHEITKDAINKAISNPRKIDINMVGAQTTRRVLDRLVGYKITPVLWQHMSSFSQSAGRVQSCVLNIVINKEKEIEKSISEPYYKTTCTFNIHNELIKSVLTYFTSNEVYMFDNDNKAKEFLKLITKKTKFVIKQINNKEVSRKPPAPFITSSLQQEASTRLHFNVKRTMDIAQKLYEAGFITYMRTDCPNISKEAITASKKYIVENFGKEYSNPQNYQAKKNAQEAHECIRITDVKKIKVDKLGPDAEKLYDLIWRRTIASQMSNATINIQSILVDAINTKSILLFDKQTYFKTNLETIVFDGYLKLYNNQEENKTKLECNEKDELEFHNMLVSQEYTKLPMRYNEAGLIKYLEKNGIGRPSTYASIISKVIERKYIEIKNVDGVKKQSINIELLKNYKIKEKTKDIVIGNESKKLVPTDMGKQVDEFMAKHFSNIIDEKYTANLEKYLDMIAIGNANKEAVLSNFYNEFNPIVEELLDKLKKQKAETGSSMDKLLGNGMINDETVELYIGKGPYGDYVKYKKGSKWIYASLKQDNITIDEAVKLFEYPKIIGKIKNAFVTINKGQFGFYLKCGTKKASLKDTQENITLEEAIKLLSDDPYSLKTFNVKDKVICIKNGEYGFYAQITSGKNKRNVALGNIDVNKITLEEVMAKIVEKDSKPKYNFKKN